MVADVGEEEGSITKNIVWFKVQDIPEAVGSQVSLHCRPAHLDKYQEHSISITVPEGFTRYNLEVVFISFQSLSITDHDLSSHCILVQVLSI